MLARLGISTIPIVPPMLPLPRSARAVGRSFRRSSILAGLCVVTALVAGLPRLARADQSENRDSDHSLRGNVRQADGSPVRGARVQLFVAGRKRAEALSDSLGAYELDFGLEAGGDPSIFVACVPGQGALAPEFALVRASEAARRLGLFSECWPRVAIDSRWDVTIKPRVDRRAEIVASGCWRDPTSRPKTLGGESR